MKGWIKLHRSIIRHWIFDNPNYFKAWCIMLLVVNHDKSKVLIGSRIIECERGQSLLSLNSWVYEFGVSYWTIQRVRTFFNLLKKDGMIEIENISKLTRITVCNYDNYQDGQHDDNTMITRSENEKTKKSTQQNSYDSVCYEKGQHDCNTIITTNKKDNNIIYSKDIVKNFYVKEILKNRGQSKIKEYLLMVKVIFGKTKFAPKLENVLSLKKQIGYHDFLNLISASKKHNKKIVDMLLEMENYRDIRKKTSAYLTLLNWIKKEWKN